MSKVNLMDLVKEAEGDMYDNYMVTVRLTNDMYGTNPMNPNIMDKHIIDRQRKIAMGESKVNKKLSQYVDAAPMSTEDSDVEMAALMQTLNTTIKENEWGDPLTTTEFNSLVNGEKNIVDLRESFKELDMTGTTVFFRDAKGLPCIGNHMIKGFLKAAVESISKTLPVKKGKMLFSSSYSVSTINQHVAVFPKLIESSQDVKKDLHGKTYYEQRSLRAMTAQGPRVSLAKSEVLPEGTQFNFNIMVIKDSQFTGEILARLLAYGKLSGLGQWRNAGKGQFEVVEIAQA